MTRQTGGETGNFLSGAAFRFIVAENSPALFVYNREPDHRSVIQTVGGTGNSGIIGADSHFHLI